MESRGLRAVVLILAGLIVFGVACAIGLALIPEPRTDSDYLVIGAAATLLALGAIFLTLIKTTLKSRDTFIRHRPGPADTEPPTESPEQENTPQT